MQKFQGVSIASEDTYFQIVGVVADIKSVGPQQPAIPIVFVPFTVRGGNFLLLKTAMVPDSLKRAVQEQVWQVDPNQIFVVLDPLTTFLQRLTYAPSEFGVAMFGPLASIALLLVIAGVFSVTAYTVSLQTHEIGIRMALGAQQGGIMKMVLWRGLRLVAAGNCDRPGGEPGADAVYREPDLGRCSDRRGNLCERCDSDDHRGARGVLDTRPTRDADRADGSPKVRVVLPMTA